ncbi:MAG: hypothetical protein KGL70_12960 [Betaproteobacteria bacterium]|nr:hypothetical protein [Betaproteobacteria bacterium]MDE2003300.1 hypothetical protein [Betaproteobacteria bacterium]MDE2209506.1 hypothetical protein [Betaproteobacteria bacterium]MDE2360280.1 hypothetical protein [Betaproteobacteria bacterium]
MDTRAPIPGFDFANSILTGHAGGRRGLRYVLAWLTAAAVLWLTFAAYGQPEFILDVAGLRLC